MRFAELLQPERWLGQGAGSRYIQPRQRPEQGADDSLIRSNRAMSRGALRHGAGISHMRIGLLPAPRIDRPSPG
ncbi:MAG: hypothetical protein OXC91_07185 [Rhodobacteraceae bacterium]|nr:hypothetical protein [Paracoccaceae bacterium]